jgi:hypothetical protein
MSPILKFLAAARNLAKQGFKKEEIYKFARQEFGEINELMQKQIENIFLPPKPTISKNKPLDPDDVLPNYNETPGEFARRETPGSKENLLQELKIAYEREFNRLRGDETAEELKEMLKNLDTDGVPFAKGGIADVRVGFVKGKGATKVKQLIEYIIKQFSPMDAMKEVNKVIGKQGKYKNLTQKDIDEIVEKTEDFIFQRDPDDLYVEDRDLFKQKTDDVDLSQGMIDLDELNFTSNAKAAKETIDNTSVNKEIKEGVAEIMSDTSPAALEKSIEVDNLRLKYPGMDKNLAEQIATEGNPRKKADIIAMVEQTFKMSEQGMSGDDIIQAFKNTPRTKQADGGITQLRNGYYGGGQAMVGEDLSEIGHGSDSLMARNMQLAPNGQATTSTGLNYLLGQDNETVRVPYNEGNMVLPKAKPTQSPLVELSRIYKTYEDAMPGVSKDTQKYLQQDFIQKLNDAGVSQEAFMTYRMQNNLAEGGPARQGYVGGGGVNLARRGFLKLAGATVASVAALKTGLVKILGKGAATTVPKAVTIPAGSGAPAWFEGMVNKVLADGIDITKTASTLDGQVVKSLDTPTGKVDVTFDTRTGSIDAFYKGENTALGESVDMRYTVGQADEGTKGLKPADEFEAVEAVPEMQGFNYDDVELEFGENVVGDIKSLYSDTSELAELGGQKMLIKDISESIKKKKVLKDMNKDPMGFANDTLERTGIPADPPHDALTKMRYHEN